MKPTPWYCWRPEASVAASGDIWLVMALLGLPRSAETQGRQKYLFVAAGARAEDVIIRFELQDRTTHKGLVAVRRGPCRRAQNEPVGR
jgi:hypothetical protein